MKIFFPMGGTADISKEERIGQIQDYLCERFRLPREQVGELLPNFIAALSAHMRSLEEALQSGDLILLGRAGHTMKGALLNLGLHDCVDIALEIETKGKSQDSSIDYRALIENLRNNLKMLIA